MYSRDDEGFGICGCFAILVIMNLIFGGLWVILLLYRVI